MLLPVLINRNQLIRIAQVLIAEDDDVNRYAPKRAFVIRLEREIVAVCINSPFSHRLNLDCHVL